MLNTSIGVPVQHSGSSRATLATRCVAIALIVLSMAVIVPLAGVGAQATTISGNVYEDRNDNGGRDAGDAGIAGVVVTVYTRTGASVGQTTSLADGTYSLIPTAVGPYRVEISSIPSGMQPSAVGTTNGSTVVFLPSPGTADFGVTRPSQYCQANPDIATTCHLPGNNLTNDAVLYSMPYTSSGFTALPTAKALQSDIGTTWGLAYQPASDSLFTTSFMKRHAALAGDRTGAIYRTSPARGATPTTSVFLDLNTLLGAGTAGTAARTAPVDYNTDAGAFDQVGKIALGDIDLGEDGDTLWTINLNTRELYRIPIGVVATAPTTAAQIGQFAIPQPTGAGVCPNATDIRPFALDVHNGLIYVGMVCSAQSSQLVADLRAFVYTFDPISSTFSAAPVLTIPLNYPRRCVDRNPAAVPPACSGADMVAAWRPWPNLPFSFTAIDNPADTYVAYPQPWLTDIVFDGNDMILAFRDRFGDQTGFAEKDLAGVGAFTAIASGDILRACANGVGGWATESNATCGLVTGGGTGSGQGPGGGDFYIGDSHPNHDGIGVGGLAQVPGAGDVVLTVFDPIPTRTFEGGIVWLNNTTGTQTRGYRVYGDNNTTVIRSRFAKSNGMGDLLALCDAAPVEIGNRVWFDANGDGKQGPDEPPLAGVRVELVGPGGQTITAVTDSNGNYIFSNANRTTTGNSIYNIPWLTYGQAYSVRIPLNQSTLNQLFVTGQDTDSSSGGNSRDSDGDNQFAPGGTSASGFTTTSFTVGGPGQNNHSYDFGFTISPLAIVLSELSAQRLPNATAINWTTIAELNTFGYRIYRSDDGTWEHGQLLTPELIPAIGHGEGQSYRWLDTTGTPTAETRYWLVEVETSGVTNRHGPIAVSAQSLAMPYSVYMPTIGQ